MAWFLSFIMFCVALAGGITGYIFAPEIKRLFLNPNMPDKPTHPNKPQIHEVHVIFKNRLCIDGDGDKLNRIVNSLISLNYKIDKISENQDDTVSQQSLNKLKKAVSELRQMSKD